MTPTLRLADSRQAIALQLFGRDAAPPARPDTGTGDVHRPQRGAHDGAGSGAAGVDWWRAAGGIAAAWWENHPAHIALDLATPALTRRVRDKPLQMLALAAGAGAVVAIARPWRLVSAAGIALALLRSSRLPDTLLTLLAAQNFSSRGTAPLARGGGPQPPPPE